MPADLLDNVLVEVSCISEELAGDVVGMLQAAKEVGGHGQLGPLPKLGLGVLGLQVERLYPLMVDSCVGVRNMIFENNHVRVGNLFRSRR